MSRQIYDNSNLAESYSGLTTPLTFSFARYVYQEVYKSFCQMMGVKQKTIDKNQDMFPQMVNFIGYRMYYNLINWYRLISFLPGYKFNRRFLEKMLGVKKQYNFSENKKYNFWQKYFLDFPTMLWQFIKIIFSFFFMGRLVNNFNNNFDRTYKKSSALELSDFDLQKLRKIYLSLVNDLTKRWKVPIANDLAVMISTGLADKLFKQWLGQDDVYEYLKIKSHSPLVSLDPGLEILSISKKVSKNHDILVLFKNNKVDDIYSKLKTDYKDEAIAKEIFSYIQNFGSRSPNELKLESMTMNEDPLIFINFLKKNILNCNTGTPKKTNTIQGKTLKNKNIFWPKKIILNIIIEWATNSIERREQTRFKRTLIFGFARKIFLQMGAKLVSLKKLNEDRDVFYLKISEIFALIDNKLEKNNIADKIKTRKEAMIRWEEIDLPRRIETDKNIKDLESELLNKNKNTIKKTDLHGIMASQTDQKSLRGNALVMKNFDPEASFNKKILVTKQTDPGWSMVFPLISGLIVERGGMLSHAAILARELNIPCLIGVTNATDLIKNNSIINLDFKTGKIHYE